VLTKQAQGLIKNVLDDGQFYLTRRGGIRKGSGTFYTRPQLAVLIARQTLQPLLYTYLDDGTAIPKKPYEILNIKVCDPACGSAAFLVAALHYLTEVLFESLAYY
jgi:type I restriction-modification system DNA methylase subunit